MEKGLTPPAPITVRFADKGIKIVQLKSINWINKPAQHILSISNTRIVFLMGCIVTVLSQASGFLKSKCLYSSKGAS